jgi:hypothetical protein
MLFPSHAPFWFDVLLLDAGCYSAKVSTGIASVNRESYKRKNFQGGK